MAGTGANGKLGGLDAAFLEVETARGHLHMGGVLVLDPTTIPGGWDFERFRDFLANRVASAPPLRRRLVETPLALDRPRLVEAVDLDLSVHLRRVALPAPGGMAELEALAADFHSRPLDRRLPLWEMVVVEGLAGGRVAVLAKVHHALMDGMSGMRLARALFTDRPDAVPDSLPAARSAGGEPKALQLLLEAMPFLLGQPLRLARVGARTAGVLLRGAAGRGRSAPPPVVVPRSVLNRRISPWRSVALASLPLARIRGLAHAHGATVNDLALCLAGGALRRLLGPRRELPRASLVAAVPAALRAGGEGGANAFSVRFVPLGTDIADPLRRLRAIHRRSRRAARREASVGGNLLPAWADVPPPLLFRVGTRVYELLNLGERMAPLCNTVVSTVRGFEKPVYFGGARLAGIHPLGPIFDGLALNVTAVGHQESLDFGLVACRRLFPDLGPLAAGLGEELTALEQASGRRGPRGSSEGAAPG